MRVMSGAKFDRSVTVKTTPKAQKALGRAVAVVKAAEAVRWRGRAATLEAVVNASWAFLGDLPEADLERLMAAYIPYLEALMRGEAPAPPGLRLAPAGDDDIPEHPDVDVEIETSTPPSRRPRKRGNSG
jgi:hypothetical protein